MNSRTGIVWASFWLLATSTMAQPGTQPHAKVIPLATDQSSTVLSGPPESVTMRSGLVLLASGKSVGKHSTGQHEEVLIVLEGKGQMTFADGSSLPVEANHAVYCPPATEHNVTNTGSGPLRYVYVVAAVPAAAH